MLQVAEAVGISPEDVHAGIKPAGKAALVEKLKAQARDLEPYTHVLSITGHVTSDVVHAQSLAHTAAAELG